MSKRIANKLIPNTYFEFEEGPGVAAFVQVPRKYGATKPVLDAARTPVLRDGKPVLQPDLIDANTFHAARHVACVAMNNPPPWNPREPDKSRQNDIEDSKRSRAVIKELKGVNKNDEHAPFLWFDDSTHAWLLRMLNERGTAMFGVQAADVLEAFETILKEDEAAAPSKTT